jgi:hypothetical protein
MKAERVIGPRRRVLPDGTLVETVVWRLPEPTPDRPHGLKYRLYCGRDGKCLVRYDNEIGKGDHIHYGEREVSYQFISLPRLLADFEADVKRLTQGD